MSVRPIWDAGLQPERTTLAWQRTAFAVAVCALGVLRLGLGRSSVPGIVVGSLAMLAAVAAIVVARAGYRRTIDRLEGNWPIGTVGPAALGTLSVALLGLAALGVLAT